MTAGRSAFAVPILTFFLLFSGVSLPADNSIEIYKNFNPGYYGVAFDRSEIKGYPLGMFIHSSTVDAPPGGILTAVTFAGRLREDLIELLKDSPAVSSEGLRISRSGPAGGEFFRVTSDETGIDITFSLEKPSGEIYDVLDLVYPNRPDAAMEVKTHYADNYMLRIRAAENFKDPEEGVLDFEEALVAATLVGESFQHLLGIRDGFDLLGNLGYLVIKRDYSKVVGVQYRQPAEGWEELNRFLVRLNETAGDPVENLYRYATAGFRIREQFDREPVLPGEFVRNMKGTTVDQALFFCDILLRLGIEAKMLYVRTGGPGGDIHGAVVFRRDRLWWFIDRDGLRVQSAPVWGRLPAIAYGETVSWMEIDILKILEDDRYPAPEEGDWTLSTY